MSTNERQITSESVTAGHPDKMCDCISDAILDACLTADPNARVAVETMVKGLDMNGEPPYSHIIIAGEVTLKEGLEIDYEAIARQTAADIGYTDLAYGMDATNPEYCRVQVLVSQQSTDISQGVGEADSLYNQGAGDQGIMFGYASRESEMFEELKGSYMPIPILLAHRLTDALTEWRLDGRFPWARPDGKSQVTVSYDRNGKPNRVETVVIAIQHDDLANEQFDGDVAKEQAFIAAEVEKMVRKTIPAELREPPVGLDHDEMSIVVNGTGRFLQGGPHADTGLTGRKIVVDAYGGHAPHGGGAFSGKDPSKVDRSATYFARYVARAVCEKGLAQECEISLAYAIGQEQPISLQVNSKPIPIMESKVIDPRAKGKVRKFVELFDFRPSSMIQCLKLKQPVYRRSASGGHFGREGFPWERKPRPAHALINYDGQKIPRFDPYNRLEESMSTRYPISEDSIHSSPRCHE